MRAMRRLWAIASVGIFVLPLAGCGSNTEETSTIPAPQVAATEPAAKPFAKPAMVAQNPSVVTSPGLIQPTNANQRAKQVQTGRQDPFAGLFIQARPSVASSGSPAVSQPGNPTVVTRGSGGSGTQDTASAQTNNGNSNNREDQVAARTGTPSGSTTPGDGSAFPPPSPDENFPALPDEGAFPPPLPPTPEPELARQIAVSGVIQIGEQLQAIVQVPNEGTSRYVREGQRLSNGEILVKRIEMTSGVEPVVILEQYGVEVAKAIGEQPAQTNGSEPAPSEANPVPPSPSPEPTPPAASPVPTPLPTNIQPTIPPGVNPVPVPPPLPNGAPNEGG